MNQDIFNTLILASSFLVLFSISEFLYRKLNVKVEYTRKFVHIGTGLLTMLFPILLNNHWLVLFLCASFAVILIASFKYKFLESVNAIDRVSVGSLSYPVSVYSCYLAYDYYGQQSILFYLPILILAFCDPIAALTGKRWPLGKYKISTDNKTMMGSSAFLVSAIVVILITLSILKVEMNFAHILIVALVATLAEAFSRNGFDNIAIPILVLFTLIIFQNMML